MIVIGWAIQFLGYYYEGKSPAFFSNVAFLFIGVIWWGKKVLSRKE